MIRRFILSVLVLAFGWGCAYYWWQTSTLTTRVHSLQAQVDELHAKLAKEQSHRHGESAVGHKSESTEAASTEAPSTPLEWLSVASQHLQSCAADAQKAQSEYAAAVNDYNHAAAKPTASVLSALAEAKQKIAGIESAASAAAGHVNAGSQ